MADDKRLAFALTVIDDLILAGIKGGIAIQEHVVRRKFLERSINKALQIDPLEHANLSGSVRRRVAYIQALAAQEQEQAELASLDGGAPAYAEGQPAAGPVVDAPATVWTRSTDEA